ncbi:MAG: hypothetical protein ACP5JJ_10795, partial [Anaerolineae bacterium]
MSEKGAGPGWIENLLRPLLISSMMACLASPGVMLLEWLAEDWDGRFFLFFAFFASLEGILSERLLQRRHISGWTYLGSRAAEAALLLIVLKLVNYLALGLDSLWADVPSWFSDPGTLVTNIDLFTAFLFLPLWVGSLSVARIAAELDADAADAEPPADKTSAEYYLWLTQPSAARDRQGQLDQLAELFLWGGVILLFASTLIHSFVASIQVLAVPILLYFALGVALLSQARFSVTDIGWRAQGIPVAQAIGRRWLVWTVLFVSLVAVVALMLPTQYALGPIEAIWGALSFVVRWIMAILFVLYFLLASLFAFLFPSVTPPDRPPVLAEPVDPPGSMATGGISLPWLQVLG